MKDLVIIGLGNPGIKYSNNRHNVGYWAIDRLVSEWAANEYKTKKKITDYTRLDKFDRKIYLLKPLTFMNNSGDALNWVRAFYKLEDAEYLVIYDDVALSIGSMRIKKKGSAGGHNGVKSIITQIGTEFPRIKIGIKPEHPISNMADYVLSDFTKEDRTQIDTYIVDIPKVIEIILTDGYDKAMNQFN